MIRPLMITNDSCETITNDIDPLLLSELSDATKSERWDEVVEFAKLYPEYVRVRIEAKIGIFKNVSLLPLHLACFLDSNRYVVKVLIDIFPDSVRIVDPYFRRLPLHFSCMNKPNEEVVAMLLAAYPEGAKQKSRRDKRLPIHHACAGRASPKIIKMILEHSPSVDIADSYGMLPLHIACIRNAPMGVIDVLLNAFPQGVYSVTSNGNTPADCLRLLPDSENKREIFELLKTAYNRRTGLLKKICSIRGHIKLKEGPYPPEQCEFGSGELC